MTHLRSNQRGNAAVELAILLPVLVAVVFGAVDFGRLFFAYVTVNGAAHEAAVFAARYPNAAVTTPNALQTVVSGESGGYLTMGTGGNTILSGPSVVDGDRVRMAKVDLTYTFNPVVPIPLSGSIPVRGSSAAPMNGSELIGTMVPSPTATLVPTFTSSPTVTNTPVATNTPSPTNTPAPTSTPTNTATATVTQTPTRTPTATATVPMCVAPNYVGQRANTAQSAWTSAGFTGTFNRGGSGNFIIASQVASPAQSAGATTWPCSTSITVS